MSLHYYIDAYNVLHSTGRWAEIPIEKQRESFLRFLEEGRPTGSEKNSVTVVFDGYQAKLGTIRLSLVRVLFSNSQEADDIIKERVDEMTNARNAVVVTNDRALQKWVRGAGAKIMSCEDFLAQGAKSPVKRRSEKLDSDTMQKINTEMKRLWRLE